MSAPPVIIAAFGSLLFLVLIGFLFLSLGTRGAPRNSPPAELPSIAGVSTTNAQFLNIAFAASDFQALRTRPELKPVWEKLRRDRRRIALLSLSDLQSDVYLLWEFRRFLARHGLASNVREELAIGFESCFALVLLEAAKFVVFARGPFAFAGMFRSARNSVDRITRLGAGILARAPATQRTGLTQQWALHVSTLVAG